VTGVPTSVEIPHYLVDADAIRALTARYNLAVDNGDTDLVAELFTEDGVFEVLGFGDPITYRGREAIVEVATRPPRSQLHMTTDSLIEVAGDRATQLCTVMRTTPPKRPGQEQRRMLGRYADELVRTADGWRFERRSFCLWF
jgi:uncharacterized protein (TIGR02246 family)